jgi:hypothetical protein
VRPQPSVGRRYQGCEATRQTVSWPATGTFATRQPLLPTWLSLLYGAQRAQAPNNRHSLRGLAQAKSMCSPPHASHHNAGLSPWGAAHRLLMSYVVSMNTTCSRCSPGQRKMRSPCPFPPLCFLSFFPSKSEFSTACLFIPGFFSEIYLILPIVGTTIHTHNGHGVQFGHTHYRCTHSGYGYL